MPKIIFLPSNDNVEVALETKVLVAAKKAKVDIRFGCASCRCGTCGVKVLDPANLDEMGKPERELLERMELETDGTIRLACRARITNDECRIDLDFQDTYSPDDADFS